MRSRRLAALAAAAVLAATPTATGLLTSSSSAGAATASYSLDHFTTPDHQSHLVRWNPCRVIRYRINVGDIPGTLAKNRAVYETRVDVGRLSRATGISFSYKGRTSAVPRTGNIATQGPDVVVAFVRPAQTDFSLAGAIAGQGGNRVVGRQLADGQWQVQATKGFVVIDQPQTQGWSKSLTRRGVTRPALIGHELGHVMGLDHVSDSSELMYPTLTWRTPQSYASGDLLGLSRLGRLAGCIG